jgi:hypothetical protein
MKNLTALSVVALVVASLAFQSCKKNNSSTPTTPAKATLYDSLGGTAMVNDPLKSGIKIEAGRLLLRNVLDSTIFVIAADPKLNSHFSVLLNEVKAGNLSGLQDFSETLTDFVAIATGAKSYTYMGMDMVTAHDPAKNNRMNGKASNADFTQFETDLYLGAQKNGLQANNPALGSVAKIVESLRSAIVQK